MTHAERIAVKLLCERSLEAFTRIMFQLVQGQRLLINWHHAHEFELAERIYREELNRVIVNVAPGSTKTEIWSIHWPAWCIVQCILERRPSRWLPISYSFDLVKENTSRVRDIVHSEPFQYMWPTTDSPDTMSKFNWQVVDAHGNQHHMYGTSLGGQVTGRRAGYMQPGFTGALILDDPMPPKMETSKAQMAKSNKALNRVVRSRLAQDTTPIVMIQQRISKGDSTDFLMGDESPDDYELYKVPALVDREYLDGLDARTRAKAVADTGFTGARTSYWPAKEPTTTLLAMERADAYMFASQYQQAPDDALAEGVIYRKEMELLIADGRLCSIPIEPSLPVYTFWDLGINDDMVLWLMQSFGKELRLIACYGNNNEGMEHYINWMHDFADKYKIRWGTHLAPHDIEVRDMMTKTKRTDVAKRMGIKFKTVPRVKSKRDSIDALKQLFPRIWIDKDRCGHRPHNRPGQGGLEALKALRREWDHDNEAFTDTVGPKWATNYCDALQQMGLWWRDDVAQQAGQRAPIRSSGAWMGA